MAVIRYVNRFAAIIGASEARVKAAVARTAAQIEAGAKARSRVDTGTMRGGWQSRVIDDGAIEVYNPIEYTIYNEYGTINMDAQPMLGPAVEEVHPDFVSEIKKAWI